MARFVAAVSTEEGQSKAGWFPEYLQVGGDSLRMVYKDENGNITDQREEKIVDGFGLNFSDPKGMAKIFESVPGSKERAEKALEDILSAPTMDMTEATEFAEKAKTGVATIKAAK